jgi:alcohol dehydrogenase (cytochrome c)
MTTKARLLLMFLLLASGCFLRAGAQVSYEQLLQASQEPQSWLTYSGDYTSQRHSRLDQIHPGNVQNLSPRWIFQSAAPGKFEASPLAVNGILYVTAQENLAYAIDAHTGRAIWKYQRAVPAKVNACCGHVNRGFAMLADRLFLATLDGHVVALDSKTGNLLWDVQAGDYRVGYTFTVAPLVVKDKVIVGVSGGEYGIRGFIDAYDAETGKRAWRFNTVPAAGEPGSETWAGDSAQRGGAPAWLTGSYDPALNLIFWPTGNPSPSNEGGERGGDNLYSNCLLALDADTGKLRWYYQFTPHDVHDWDATQIPVLLDTELDGKPRQLVLQANRNGFFYALDRTNGKFLFAKPFVKLTWAKEVGPDGRPVVLKGSDPTPEGTRVCPGAIGATNFMSPSYNPQTGLFYVQAREQCDIFTRAKQTFHPGRVFLGSTYTMETEEKDWGALRALDPHTGEMKWEFRHHSAPWGGTLSTAGGLIFTGDIEGNFIALDASTGKPLWHFQTGSAIYAPPVTYALEGRQYVAIAAGAGLIVFALPDAKAESSK